MRPDLKHEWITRLRSGIPQIKWRLGREDARCAIGVLCDIAADHGVVTRTVRPTRLRSSNEEFNAVLFDDKEYDIPQKIYEWACIEPYDLRVVGGMNDAGFSFEVIASYIEEAL